MWKTKITANLIGGDFWRDDQGQAVPPFYSGQKMLTRFQAQNTVKHYAHKSPSSKV
ncbi:MAG: hypothetical protein AAB539_01360 [Patescibacteria group bacterium]